jgi:uncharacterized protein YndB with AHSA1/START domain
VGDRSNIENPVATHSGASRWSDETKELHKQMGFHEGWGQTARQLEALAKTI